MKKYSKLLLVVVLASLVFLFFFFDLKQFLSLDYIKSQQAQFQNFYATHPFFTLSGFALAYVAVTALSLPGAALLTLLAGALFGFIPGTILVSFASTIGGTLAFLTSRFLLRDYVQDRFSKALQKINQGIKKEGAFYLFTLRLIPAFPFFVINLVMGLTPMKTWTFYWVSQLGMLAGTMVYVNAGTQLGQIESLSGILSLNLILSFCLLGLFPLITKKVMAVVRKKKVGASDVQV